MNESVAQVNGGVVTIEILETHQWFQKKSLSPQLNNIKPNVSHDKCATAGQVAFQLHQIPD